MLTVTTCTTCNEPVNDQGCCINVDCATAQQQATRGAARETAKATAGYAMANEPSAWTSSGRVD